MKKLLFLGLTLLLTAALTVSSFAYFGMNDFNPVAGVDHAYEGLSLNTDAMIDDNRFGDEMFITTRNDWTPNRACDPDRTNALFVSNIAGNDTNCIKVVRSFTLFPDSKFPGDFYVSADIKPVKITSFSGFLFDYTDGSSSSTAVPHPNATAAVRDKAHDCEYILYTGYGFTFLAGQSNKIRVFVNASKTGEVDCADIDVGFDTTAGWHNYAMYEDKTAKKTNLYIDNKLIATFDFSGGSSGTVYDGAGKAILSDTNYFFGNESACMTYLGDDIEVYFDNLDVNNWTELPKYFEAPTLKAASFDTFKIDGNMASFQAADGGASAALDTVGRTVDGRANKAKKLSIRGWAGFDVPVKAFGYKIDDGEPVFGEFAQETGSDVKAAGGENASRFEIEIPVDGIVGNHRIVAVAKFENDCVVEFTPKLGENCPDTSFTFCGSATEICDYSEEGHGSCFDKVLVDEAPVSDENEDIDNIYCEGWVGYNSEKIAKYGYVIDEEEPVLTGLRVELKEGDPVLEDQHGGTLASRFKISADLRGVPAGDHVFYPVAQLEDGSVHRIGSLEVYFTITAPAEKTPAPETTKAPEATEQPAENTSAPETTEAPADETKAPDDKKSGCGSMLNVCTFALLGICLSLTRKKNG